MCKSNSPTDSGTYNEEVETIRQGTNNSIKTYERLLQGADPEKLLLISTRKQRHLREDCLVKQIFIENIVKDLEMEVCNRKYICDLSFSVLEFTSL